MLVVARFVVPSTVRLLVISTLFEGTYINPEPFARNSKLLLPVSVVIKLSCILTSPAVSVNELIDVPTVNDPTSM
jgi:hypothetical protein